MPVNMSNPDTEPAENCSLEPNSAPRSTRRTFLKRAGFGAALVGIGAAAGNSILSATAKDGPTQAIVLAERGVRIDHVTVVDPNNGSKRADQSIIVRDGRISDVMSTASLPVESSLRVIDGAGRFAVPGYNDMHTHVLQSPRTELGFALMLAQGITGIRQMEGSEQLLIDRAENRLGLNEKAPRLLQMPGALLLPFNANTIEDARAEIVRQSKQGADFIKMALTGPEVFFAAIDAAHEKGLRIAGHLPPSIRIEAASDSGFDSIEHLGTGLSVFLALSTNSDALWQQAPSSLPFPNWATGIPLAGWAFDTFLKDKLLGAATHTTNAAQLALLKQAFATYSDDRAAELGELFAENQTWNIPTMVMIRSKYALDDVEFRDDTWLAKLPRKAQQEHLAAVAEFSSISPEDLDIFHEYYDRTLQTVGIWAKAGAPIMTGTDGNGRGVGNSLAIEFRELGRAGLTPLQILQATTIQPARYLRRTERMGQIARGMDADLLLLDADPLGSIEALSSISLVMRDGHDFTAADLQARVDRLLKA